jgi:hypothetical protein
VRPERGRDRRRGSSKTAMTTAWRGLLQGPPKRRDPGTTERQICAAADLCSNGGVQAWSRAFNNGGKHPHPHRGEAPIWIRRRQAQIWAAVDLGGATSTYSDSRRLLFPLCVADGLLLPRRLDLGLAGSDPFEDFFYF